MDWLIQRVADGAVTYRTKAGAFVGDPKLAFGYISLASARRRKIALNSAERGAAVYFVVSGAAREDKR